MKKDPIFEKLLEHDERFDEQEKRFDKIEEDIRTNHDDVITRLDQVMTIVKRLDQERVFTFEVIKRMQKQINTQQKDLDKIKKVLQMS